MEPALRNDSYFHRNVLLAACVLYVLTAWFSVGYHSADEHFQIIAFAQWELGELPLEHLAWEFDAGIRSSLQPWIAVAVFKIAAAFGLEDPFMRTFLLRLLTAALALIAIRGYVVATLTSVPRTFRKPFILLSYFLWFLPFLHVRFSSEGWSGIFLVLCLTTVLQREQVRWWAVRAGAFAGIAILCRPPTGLIILSAMAWMLLVRKDPWREVFTMVIGASIVMLLGVLLDSAFYGHFNPTVWKYVSMGFGGDPAHRFDELPWYYYAPWMVKYGIPPIGGLIVIAFALLCIKQPKSLPVWCILPFVVVHSYIPHKELRFLYPLADLAPLVLVLGLNELAPWLRTLIMRPLRLIGILVLTATNLLGLVIVTTSAAGEGRAVLAKEIHNRTIAPNERIAYLIQPDIAWRIGLPAFYLPKGMREIAIGPGNWKADLEPINYVVAHPNDAGPFAAEQGLELSLLARTEPRWVERAMGWYTWYEGPASWALYRVEKMGR